MSACSFVRLAVALGERRALPAAGRVPRGRAAGRPALFTLGARLQGGPSLAGGSEQRPEARDGDNGARFRRAARTPGEAEAAVEWAAQRHWSAHATATIDHASSADGSTLEIMRLMLRLTSVSVAFPCETNFVCILTPPCTGYSRVNLSSVPTTRHFLLLSSIMKAMAVLL